MNSRLDPGPRSSRRLKPLIATAIALLFLAGLFFAIRPSDEEKSAQTTVDAQSDTTAQSQTATHVSTTAETKSSPATTEQAPSTGTSSRPVRINIAVRGGRPKGGVVRVSVDNGEDVLLVVRADAAESVHLHGYDREAAVAPNSPAQIGFKADKPGRFEVELEESGVLIAEISVQP